MFEVGGPSTLTATFVRAPLRVTVSVSGGGRVTSSPAGIACPGACSTTFRSTQARLTARAAKGWRFAGWSGACRGTGTCTVAAAGAVRARFVRR
jgi:endoglucanase